MHIPGLSVPLAGTSHLPCRPDQVWLWGLKAELLLSLSLS